jgi:hypothetical protein
MPDWGKLTDEQIKRVVNPIPPEQLERIIRTSRAIHESTGRRRFVARMSILDLDEQATAAKPEEKTDSSGAPSLGAPDTDEGAPSDLGK